MNELYLMIDEKRNYALVKAGFAKNIESRIYAYTTHNPEVRCVSHVKTQLKSKREVEKMFHEEIIKRDYEMVTAIIDGKKTEWFRVSYEDPFYSELCEKGLCAFNCGKRRKNYGELVIGG